jgi:hypothetical protein
VSLKPKAIAAASLVVALGVAPGFAQSGEAAKAESADGAAYADAWVKKELVIVGTAASYKEAIRTAQNASRLLKLKLDLRGLVPAKEGGLTVAPSECEKFGPDAPCYYVARGRFDDGPYVSIEYSSDYRGLRPKLYMVVVASGSPDDPDVSQAKRSARAFFRDVYSRIVSVYVGCMS